MLDTARRMFLTLSLWKVKR